MFRDKGNFVNYAGDEVHLWVSSLRQVHIMQKIIGKLHYPGLRPGVMSAEVTASLLVVRLLGCQQQFAVEKSDILFILIRHVLAADADTESQKTLWLISWLRPEKRSADEKDTLHVAVVHAAETDGLFIPRRSKKKGKR